MRKNEELGFMVELVSKPDMDYIPDIHISYADYVDLCTAINSYTPLSSALEVEILHKYFASVCPTQQFKELSLGDLDPQEKLLSSVILYCPDVDIRMELGLFSYKNISLLALREFADEKAPTILERLSHNDDIIFFEEEEEEEEKEKK